MAAKFRDPFDVLPLEIAVMVLRHLNFKQIVAILRVSKKWAQFLSSIRELWLHMDFSRARSTVSMSAIRSYLRRSKGMLTHATIDHVIPSAMDKVLELLSRCPDLTHLQVAGRYDGDRLYNLFKTSKKLKSLIISSDIPVTRECMVKFLDNLPNLERLEVHQSLRSPDDNHLSSGRLPNLKALALTTPQNDFAVGALELRLPCYDGFQDYNKIRVEPLPNLEELSLRCGAEDVHSGYFVELESLFHPRLRKLSLSYLELIGNMFLPSTLEHLSIQSCKLHDVEDNTVHSYRQLPNLTTLVLDDFAWVTPSRLASLLSPDKSVLRVLEVKNCFKISGSDIARLASGTRALKGVQTLTLEGMYHLDDATVRQLLESMPELRILNIPHTAVSGVTIKSIVDMRVAEKERRQKKRSENSSPQSSDDPQADNDRKPLIEIVNLKGCENVSLDAIEFGRKQGLTIIR
ncbi:Leucine Rich Repeat domain protein [Rasamsonia emersonii CBS 393.64]|uniref:Leucine Rich Repeat domain protein n=1 Tax=Rasamsonia emersonii (strain ATCC 16479 / CBS 393.64 / IMI 116815) TaxID=1408163 RepID=A0A0F4YKX8_RASE3|nr:Leucine Rich Repeat domain protein [Rasamsonia emersonii CBS 393.64]KKA18526.1 Leucine Rich Repeat domain protein [Rasamsonia emersonii CBS 393.64]